VSYLLIGYENHIYLSKQKHYNLSREKIRFLEELVGERIWQCQDSAC
jgi:hypothetical protein